MKDNGLKENIATSLFYKIVNKFKYKIVVSTIFKLNIKYIMKDNTLIGCGVSRIQ